MKSHSQVLCVCAVLAFAFAGCGGTENDTRQSQTAESQPVAKPPQEGEQAQMPQDEREVDAMGKRCNASCSVVNAGVPSCPSYIGGTGTTKLFGGCGKACEHAKGDAASKLSAGCILNVCNFTGC
jgi:hypothetical protein